MHIHITRAQTTCKAEAYDSQHSAACLNHASQASHVQHASKCTVFSHSSRLSGTSSIQTYVPPSLVTGLTPSPADAGMKTPGGDSGGGVGPVGNKKACSSMCMWKDHIHAGQVQLSVQASTTHMIHGTVCVQPSGIIRSVSWHHQISFRAGCSTATQAASSHGIDRMLRSHKRTG